MTTYKMFDLIYSNNSNETCSNNFNPAAFLWKVFRRLLKEISWIILDSLILNPCPVFITV